MEEKAVKKLLHRRLKDITMSSEFRNFLITLIVLIVIIFYLGGQPTWKELQKRERIDLKTLISACLDAVEMGGKEVGNVPAGFFVFYCDGVGGEGEGTARHRREEQGPDQGGSQRSRHGGRHGLAQGHVLQPPGVLPQHQLRLRGEGAQGPRDVCPRDSQENPRRSQRGWWRDIC